jgi:hypothetical protein
VTGDVTLFETAAIMSWPSIIFWIMAGVLAIACEVLRRRRLSPMLARPCAGGEWRHSFPGTSEADIREFLQLFVDAFALPRKDYLAFRPGDRIMDVYRAINPPKWTAADGLELETFALLLKGQYGLALESMWRDDLAPGEVFDQA